MALLRPAGPRPASPGIEEKFPPQLSGGMRKRVGLARALIDRPEILLYDEPTTGLDPIATKNVDDMIRRTADDFGVTSVVISHDMASTFRIADRIAMLLDGKIVTSGTPAELLAAPHPALREFVETSGALSASAGGRRHEAQLGGGHGRRARAGGAGGGYSIFMYTSEASAREGYRVYGFFNDALGLYDKSGVRSAGIDIGKIEASVFDHGARQGQGSSSASTRASASTKTRWSSKRSASLLGEFYLDVDPGTEFDNRDGASGGRTGCSRTATRSATSTRRPTWARSSIRSTSPCPSCSRSCATCRPSPPGPVKQIAENANELVERNSVVLERLLQRVDNIAAHVEGITRTESDDIKVTVRNVREITEGLKSLVGKSEGEVSATGQELRSSVQSLQKSIDSLERSMANMETVTTRLKQGEGTAGRLLADDTIANNIEEITEDAGGFRLHRPTCSVASARATT